MTIDFTNDDQLGQLLRDEVPEPGHDYWSTIADNLSTVAPDTMAQAIDADPASSERSAIVPFITRLGRATGGLTAVAIAAALLLIVGIVVGTRWRESSEKVDVGFAQDPEQVISDQASLDALPGPRQNLDHWNAVYGVWDCTANEGTGGWLPKFESNEDDVGIHSHDDGLISIHPFFEESAGRNATFSHFADAMNFELTDDSITLEDGRVLAEGTLCGDQPAVVHLRRWQLDIAARTESALVPRIIVEDLGSERFYNDREVWVLALAPLTADIPLPPAERFAALDAWGAPADGSGITLPSIATSITRALDADRAQPLAAPPGPVTIFPSNEPTTVLSRLLTDPAPDWTDLIIEETFRPLASVASDDGSEIVLATFQGQMSGVPTPQCDAAIDMDSRELLAMRCEPLASNEAGLTILEQEGHLLLGNVPAGTAYVVAETTTGLRIATSPLAARAYLMFDDETDLPVEITFYNDSLQPTTTCVRERPGGVLTCA